MTRERAIKRLQGMYDAENATREDLIKEYGSLTDRVERIISENKEVYCMAIEALKQPERKKGKWIDARNYCGEFLCSNCHETNINNSYKYCPNCGAEMEGEGN